MITMIVFVRRKQGLSREEFSRYWFERHAPLVKSVPEFMRHVRKYIQYHPAPGSNAAGSLFGDITDYDGVGEIWFDSREAMNAALSEPRYLEIIKPDEREFIDLDGCLSFIGDERVMYDGLG
ncbi:MAG: EthD domain-containing protein [Gammaproteobacteria bacterium]